jgi:hypothetical protein
MGKRLPNDISFDKKFILTKGRTHEQGIYFLLARLAPSRDIHQRQLYGDELGNVLAYKTTSGVTKVMGVLKIGHTINNCVNMINWHIPEYSICRCIFFRFISRAAAFLIMYLN